jgi:hypothetical protein
MKQEKHFHRRGRLDTGLMELDFIDRACFFCCSHLHLFSILRSGQCLSRGRPEQVALHAPAPNPVRTSTEVRYGLPERTDAGRVWRDRTSSGTAAGNGFPRRRDRPGSPGCDLPRERHLRGTLAGWSNADNPARYGREVSPPPCSPDRPVSSRRFLFPHSTQFGDARRFT